MQANLNMLWCCTCRSSTFFQPRKFYHCYTSIDSFYRFSLLISSSFAPTPLTLCSNDSLVRLLLPSSSSSLSSSHHCHYHRHHHWHHHYHHRRHRHHHRLHQFQLFRIFLSSKLTPFVPSLPKTPTTYFVTCSFSSVYFYLSFFPPFKWLFAQLFLFPQYCPFHLPFCYTLQDCVTIYLDRSTEKCVSSTTFFLFNQNPFSCRSFPLY